MKTTAWIKILSIAFSVIIVLLVIIAICSLGRFNKQFQAESIRIPLDQVARFQLPQENNNLEIETRLENGPGIPSKMITESWSQFRGDKRDGIVQTTSPIQFESPKIVWEVSVGEGYAGAAIQNGCAYFIDYDVPDKRDALRCLSMDDGKEIWRFSYAVNLVSDHGYSRTIPAVSKRFCVGISPKCHAFCVDALTGEKKWIYDLTKKYQTKVPQWYAGQCVLIEPQQNDQEWAIIAPGGNDSLIVALDCETGQEMWRTPNPYQWNMTHSSISRMILDDKLTYVYCGSGGVLGIDAENGKILWGTTAWKIVQATCPSPLILPDQKIFFCGGYSSGSLLLQVFKNEQGKYQTRVLKKLKESEFGSTQQTPIFYKEHIWGVGRAARKFCCLDSDANVLWRSRSRTDFGDGPYLILNDQIVALNDDGLLIVAETNPEKWSPLHEIQIIEGEECWAPLAFSQGNLILRSLDKMICVDLNQ
ncbi:MAG: PQQ-binding-like beta-propeller repeat protein [Planctomycetia bacterium]|nr:PQQ-binding-like beta-propeller repeat protein [Planctomycetia bacterium]